MKSKPEQLYLNLLKKTLAFTLWPEPPIDLGKYNYSLNPIKRSVFSLIGFILRRSRFTLCEKRALTETERLEGKIWPPGYGDTMIGIKRLENIQDCVETVIREKVEGDFIETGVWRGGACIFMRAILAAHQVDNRKVFLADSFEGLPEPDPDKWPGDADDKHFAYDFLAVSQEEVENNFRKYDLLDDQVVFIKGFFKDTLPNAPIGKLSILRLDGDMYESTMVALENLYPKLTPGGFCIIDDFSLDGAKAAVQDYRRTHGIDEKIENIDWTGVYWRKARL
jgi:hypothetical protein